MANSEQSRESVGQYNSMKPALNASNPTHYKVEGVEVSEDLARAIADRKTGDPNAYERAPAPAGNANGNHIDDEMIKQLTAKYTGGQVGATQFGPGGDGRSKTGGGVKGKVQEAGENLAGKAGQAKDSLAHKAAQMKSSVANKAGEVTGRAEAAPSRADKFKDDFSTSQHYREEEGEGEERTRGKALYKKPLVVTTILLGVTAVVGFLLTGSGPRHSKRGVDNSNATSS